MTSSIDHTHEALSAIKASDETLDGCRSVPRELDATLHLQRGLIHATLALAEHQRIANLIQLYDSRFPDDAEWAKIRAQIRDHLVDLAAGPLDQEWEYADADCNGRIMSLNESMAFMGPPKRMRRRKAGEWEEVPS